MGGEDERPGNTMVAFQHAVDLGYRYLETDVQATSDGVVLTFHDDTLHRVTDRTGVVSELPWEEVRKATVQGEPIPRLDELLDAFPDCRVNIDAKHDAVVEPLVDVIRRANAHDRVCLGSFSAPRINRLRRLVGDRVCTSMPPAEVARLRLAAFRVGPAGRIAAGCVQVPTRQYGMPLADKRMVEAAHRRGLQLHVWTINEPVEIERLLDNGVDGIMSARPTILKEVLVSRGQWTAT